MKFTQTPLALAAFASLATCQNVCKSKSDTSKDPSGNPLRQPALDTQVPRGQVYQIKWDVRITWKAHPLPPLPLPFPQYNPIEGNKDLTDSTTAHNQRHRVHRPPPRPQYERGRDSLPGQLHLQHRHIRLDALVQPRSRQDALRAQSYRGRNRRIPVLRSIRYLSG